MTQQNSNHPINVKDLNYLQCLSDRELYKKCQEYGLGARTYLRKFAGLLPEVYKRQLYKRKGFVSIHEFAAKLACMSHDVVDKILRLSERLQDKPTLKKMLESGSAGWSKIEKVSFVVKPETDKLWAEKVNILPQPSLEEYVKIYRSQTALQSDSNTIYEIPQGPEKWNRISFAIDPGTEIKLRLLKKKFEKENKIAMGWNEVLKRIFCLLEENSVFEIHARR